MSNFKNALFLLLLGLSGAACSSVPMVTIPEEEHLSLQRRVRVLERELSDTKSDYEKERQETLAQRERLRTIEHPYTMAEQAERLNCGVPEEYDYYGTGLSSTTGDSFPLYTKKAKGK